MNCLFSGERLSNYYIYTYVPSKATWNEYDSDPGELFYYHAGISPLVLTIAAQKIIEAQYVKIIELDPVPFAPGKGLNFCEFEIYSTGIAVQSKYRGYIHLKRNVILIWCLTPLSIWD